MSALLEAYEAGRSQPAPDALASLRDAGALSFLATGLPTPRNERWKYTSLRSVEATPFAANGTPASVPGHLLAGSDRIVLQDGRITLHAVGTLPAGVYLGPLNGAPEAVRALLGTLLVADSDPLVAMNAAVVVDALVLSVPDNVVLPRTLELVLAVTAGVLAAPRVLVVLGANAGASIVERHVGGEALLNAASEVFVGDGATLRHWRLQEDAPGLRRVISLGARVGRDATYRGFTLTLGGRLVRNQSEIELAGTGAWAHMDGAYLADGDSHVDNTSRIVHAAEHGTSRQTIKGVLDDKARGVFQGKILVKPGAQKTDGFQLNRSLLLSPDAEIDTKPELEIYADDVKCSHGATTGKLDDEALFYLRSRGIPLAEARDLLIEAFIADAIELIDEPAVRDAFRRLATRGTVPVLLQGEAA